MSRSMNVEALIGRFGPNERIFISGSSGEPTGVIDAIMAAGERSNGWEIVTSYVAGINPLNVPAEGPGPTVTGMFMHTGAAAAQRTGRFRHLPIGYSGFLRHIRDRLQVDTTIVMVSPPDAQGRCSLGPTVEFIPDVIAKGGRVMAVINPNVPRMAGSLSLDYARFDAVIESDAPLRTLPGGGDGLEAGLIADHVAPYITDGATLQIGIGKVPTAIFERLHDRRGLKLRSGLLSDSAIGLAASGATEPGSAMSGCVLIGSPEFYRWCGEEPRLRVVSVSFSHDVAQLVTIPNFVAINSALEVDLFGQCNLEFAGGKARSGLGGAPDFALAGHLSAQGLSVIALPAAIGGDKASRIVAKIGAPGVVSLPRNVADIVVTEHGSADLRGKSVHERAEALIQIAAPVFRAELIDHWRRISALL